MRKAIIKYEGSTPGTQRPTMRKSECREYRVEESLTAITYKVSESCLPRPVLVEGPRFIFLGVELQESISRIKGVQTILVCHNESDKVFLFLDHNAPIVPIFDKVEELVEGLYKMAYQNRLTIASQYAQPLGI